MSFEDDWLESRYDDLSGEPGPDAGDINYLEVEDDCECDKCGAPAGEDCFPDCPYIIGE